MNGEIKLTPVVCLFAYESQPNLSSQTRIVLDCEINFVSAFSGYKK